MFDVSCAVFAILPVSLSYYFDPEDVNMFKGPPWSWSYGSLIYNYLCNQCLSLLTLWVRIPLLAMCTR